LLDEVQFGGDTQLPFAGGPNSDDDNAPFDPMPSDGTFSPVAKGRVLGVELSAAF
jgi:iron complex outermembrane receptor protein